MHAITIPRPALNAYMYRICFCYQSWAYEIDNWKQVLSYNPGGKQKKLSTTRKDHSDMMMISRVVLYLDKGFIDKVHNKLQMAVCTHGVRKLPVIEPRQKGLCIAVYR